MKIFLNIEADSPAELDQAIAGLAAKLTAVTGVKADIVETQVVPATAKAETKTRGKKAETTTAVPADQPVAKEEPATAPVKLTREDIRNSLIDVLNEWTEAENKREKPDPDVRVKQLKPMLAKLGVEKIGEIAEADFDKVQPLVDASREALKVYAASFASAEE